MSPCPLPLVLAYLNTHFSENRITVADHHFDAKCLIIKRFPCELIMDGIMLFRTNDLKKLYVFGPRQMVFFPHKMGKQIHRYLDNTHTGRNGVVGKVPGINWVLAIEMDDETSFAVGQIFRNNGKQVVFEHGRDYLKSVSERVVLVFLSEKMMVVTSPLASLSTTLSAKWLLPFSVMVMFL